MFAAPNPNIKVFGPPPKTNIWDIDSNWLRPIIRKDKINKIFNVRKEDK